MNNSRTQSSQQSVWGKLVVIQLAASGLWLWFASLCWPYGQRGWDIASIGAVLCFAVSMKSLYRAYDIWDLRRRKLSILNDIERSGIGHGQARWATSTDTEKAKMHEASGLFLGRMYGKDIYYPKETHLLTVAPPSAGKGTCLVVPNLLLDTPYSRSLSVIVSDPKLELYAITHKHRRDVLGHEIILLCPFAEKMSQELEMPIIDNGFNPLSILKDGPDIKDDAELISSLLIPGKPNASAENEFWDDSGQTILTAFILYLFYKYASLDLPMLRQSLLAPPEEIMGSLIEMSETDALNGALREFGGKLLGTLRNAPKQFEGAMSMAQKALRIYDSVGPMAQHVSCGEIDFTVLKEKPVTIYISLPGDRIHTHAAWLSLVISLAIELIGRDRSNRRVLFLLDEFCNMGFMPNVLRAMAQYRGQGLQVWAIAQQLSQIEKIYGKEGLREFLGMAEVINSFGMWELQSMKIFAEMMGQSTARQFGHNITPEQNGGDFGFNYSASDHAQSLMRPEDIRTMSDHQQLIFYRNLPPILAEKVSYLHQKKWRKQAAPNPYYRKNK